MAAEANLSARYCFAESSCKRAPLPEEPFADGPCFVSLSVLIGVPAKAVTRKYGILKGGTIRVVIRSGRWLTTCSKVGAIFVLSYQGLPPLQQPNQPVSNQLAL